MTAPVSSTSSNANDNNNDSSSSSSSSNIRVVVRIRPRVSAEEGTPVVTSLNALLGSTVNTTTEETASPELVQVALNGSASSDSNNNNNNSNSENNKRWFELDAVVDPQATQADVYERSGARHAVQHSLWEGYNCTLMAYGQSGAGKTHTMMGTTTTTTEVEANSSITTDSKSTDLPTQELDEHAGLIPRACHDLFQQIQLKCTDASVEFSFLEIYNETLRDLLAAPSNNNNNATTTDDRSLPIRETRNGEVYVSGLTARPVASPHEIGLLLHEASQRRVVGSTALNAVSSRSHALCLLRIRGTTIGTNGGPPQQFQSKLTLVDLAGSERLKKTGAQGNRQKEGININKSLLVLGQVVAALSEQQQQQQQQSKRGNFTPRKPPYRDSKLTRLLQDSLGGNSRTILVACVSPAECHVEESINTLRYATAARNIRNTATRNVMTQNQLLSPAEVARLQRENQRLQQQVLELQASLQQQQQLTVEGDHPRLCVSSTVSFDNSTVEEDKKLLLLDDGSSAGEALTDDTTLPSTSSSSSSSSSSLSAAHINSPRRSELDTPDESLLPRAAAWHHNDNALRELIDLKTENCELRAELDEVRADAAASKRAAVQLSNVMDKLQELQGEQVAHKRMEYRHLQKEEKWVQFLSDMLDTRCEEMGKLADDFDLVVRVVESCPDVVPASEDSVASPTTTKTSSDASELSSQRSRRWLRRVSSDVLSQVALNLSSHNGRASGTTTTTNRRLSSAVPMDDQELRQQLLRQHVVFFKMQMDEIVNCIRVEAESLLQIRASLRRDRERLENEIGTSEFVKDSLDSADGQLLQQLTTLLIGPVREV